MEGPSVDAERIRYAASVLDVPFEYLQQLLNGPATSEASDQTLPFRVGPSPWTSSLLNAPQLEVPESMNIDLDYDNYPESQWSEDAIPQWSANATAEPPTHAEPPTTPDRLLATPCGQSDLQVSALPVSPSVGSGTRVNQTNAQQHDVATHLDPSTVQRSSQARGSSDDTDSLVIITPASTGTGSSRDEGPIQRVIMPKAEIARVVDSVCTQGPCSKTWKDWALPKYVSRSPLPSHEHYLR